MPSGRPQFLGASWGSQSLEDARPLRRPPGWPERPPARGGRATAGPVRTTDGTGHLQVSGNSCLVSAGRVALRTTTDLVPARF